jgi:acetyltransferase-like isoleucine patch superfamily enzyme
MYMELTIGKTGLFPLVVYELLTGLLGLLPGGVGIYARRKCYPLLLKKVGCGLIIGRNVVIRHPDKIELGDHVTIDDNCLIDARGAGPSGFVLGDEVIINRGCMIQARSGPIHLRERTSIGSNSVIVSMDGVEIGESVLTGVGCYITAGSYHFDDVETPVMDQGAYSSGPIRIGSRTWFGTRVTVLDGVTIGEGAVVGAGALVNRDVPKNAIAYGVPAKVQMLKHQREIAAQ